MMKQKKKQCGGGRGGVVVKKMKKTKSTAAASALGVVLKNMKKTQTTTAASYHPPYFEMIKEALLASNNTNGSSPHAISKYMEEKYNSNLPSNFKKILGIQLKNSVAKGKLIKIKASYKLYSPPPPEEEEEEKKKMEQQLPELTALTDEEELKELMRNLKPYVKVPWKKKNESVTPEDVEEVMSYGKGRPTEEEKKDDIKYDFNFHRLIHPRLKGKKSIWLPEVITKDFEETCQKYCNQLRRSEGFEIYDFPYPSLFLPILPKRDLDDENLIHKAKKA